MSVGAIVMMYMRGKRDGVVMVAPRAAMSAMRMIIEKKIAAEICRQLEVREYLGLRIVAVPTMTSVIPSIGAAIL